MNGGWDILMYTLDFERVTAEKLGGFAWVLDAVEVRLRETERLDRAASERIARLRGELHASRLLSFRAADDARPRSSRQRDLGDGEALGGAARPGDR